MWTVLLKMRLIQNIKLNKIWEIHVAQHLHLSYMKLWNLLHSFKAAQEVRFEKGMDADSCHHIFAQ
jgi:hypothetical protein